MKPAVFLDRDGVLIHDCHYLSKLEDIQIYEDVPTGLAQLSYHGFDLIVVTNQSGVARGFFDEAFVRDSFAELNHQLMARGTNLDAQYYCPHHVSGKPPYNVECKCRKPNIGMIEKAANDRGVDLDRSYMIGDRTSDIELGLNANIFPILLTTGKGIGEQDLVRQRYPKVPILNSFGKAVEFIISGVSQTGE